MELRTDSSTEQQSTTTAAEMAVLIREFPWHETPLGPAENWSQSLTTLVSIMLSNRFPMLLWWGPTYIGIYNDAYAPILGAKHPWALGQPLNQVWKEIWHVLEPLVDRPFKGGESTWIEDILLEINRYGYTEETHFTIGYSPVPDSSATSTAGIGGVLATVHEITEKVIGERRRNVLRELGSQLNTVQTVDEVANLFIRTLSGYEEDVPFAMFYSIDEAATTATLKSSTGILNGQSLSAPGVDLQGDHILPFADALSQNKIVVVDNLSDLVDYVPEGPWTDPPKSLTLIPIPSSHPNRFAGIVVAGISSRLQFDSSYRSFYELLATQLSNALNHAVAFEEERKRSHALDQLNKAKTVFFSNISHEFRTPLTLMLNPLEELLGKSELSNGLRDNVDTAHRNALRLLKLVNTLLDFSRIESGRQQAVFSKVDLSELTEGLVSNFRSLIEKGGLQLIVECETVGNPVYVDKHMWEKIVFNLLSNALKYTLKGTIRVELRDHGNTVELSVADTGIGIAEKELPRMFERFYRVPGSAGRTHEGTGIGLSMVQELVKMLGGSIHVESVVGIGSTFTVSLPTGFEHIPPEQVASTTSSDEFDQAIFRQEIEALVVDAPQLATVAAVGRPKVLVVDDNADMRNYLAKVLTTRFDVSFATHGGHALDSIRTSPPDLVLSDIMMPVMDGIELLQAIKRKRKTQHIPVILLTARAGEESRIAGWDMGADDYLVKPFSPRELLARVSSQIATQQIRKTEEHKVLNLFEQAPAAIALLDGTRHTFSLANEGFQQLFNRSSEELVGHSFATIFPGLHSQGFVRILDETFTSGETFRRAEYEAHWITQKNGTQYYNLVAKPIKDTQGVTRSLMLHIHDVTEQVESRKQMKSFSETLEQKVEERTVELRLSNLKLESTNRELASFAYVSSHDLQEPLRKIQMFSRLIADKEKDTMGKEAQDYFTRMENAASRMQQLINDLIEYSSTTRSEKYFEMTDLNALLDEVRTELSEKVFSSRCTIRAATLPSINIIPFQFRQLFTNLITNSIKFARPGVAPEIVIENRRLDAGESPLNHRPGHQIIFKDNGIGFQPQFKEQIFGLFQRLHGRTEYAGTGIGLSIVKRVVENHHGVITADGEENSGATFRIFIPDEVAS